MVLDLVPGACFGDGMVCPVSRRLRTVGPRLACPSCESVNTNHLLPCNVTPGPAVQNWRPTGHVEPYVWTMKLI